ncbi:MAG: hypothetical protein ACRDLS_12870 [Solirubrobacteraceae bacterium]
MTFGPADEAVHAAAHEDGGAFIDALTFAFGDPVKEIYGLARLGVGAEGAMGMAVVYAGHQPVAGGSEVGVEVAERSWEAVGAAGVRATVETPFEAWTVAFDDGDGAGFELRFEAVSTPARVAAGGVEGYSQMCSVNGTVTHGGRTVEVRCLGQRDHMWGAPQLDRIELARVLSAWLGADRAVTLTAVRPTRAKQHHLDEALSGWLIEGGEPRAIADPRLSTTYDGELRQQRAGLELWMDEEGTIGRRAHGEVLCGTTIDFGDLRLETAFFHWRMEGREGVGLYDVLRRADGKRSKR